MKNELDLAFFDSSIETLQHYWENDKVVTVGLGPYRSVGICRAKIETTNLIFGDDLFKDARQAIIDNVNLAASGKYHIGFVSVDAGRFGYRLTASIHWESL